LPGRNIVLAAASLSARPIHSRGVQDACLHAYHGHRGRGAQRSDPRRSGAGLHTRRLSHHADQAVSREAAQARRAAAVGAGLLLRRLGVHLRQGRQRDLGIDREPDDLDQRTEYNTTGATAINGHKSTKQIIGRGTYLGQFQIKPKNQNTELTDEDVQTELKKQISRGKLPASDLNTLYMIYFPQSVTITLDGLTSCQDFGAYHFATNDLKLAKNNVFYAVEPDCGSSINSVTFAASHEFAEATTDNVPTPGSFPDFPQAWNDANGFEIGDKCGGSGQLTKGAGHWTVTQYWLRSRNSGAGGCSTGNYTAP
jgi:hypothetical protein